MTVHLHNRSCYSLLDSTTRIPSLIQQALQNHDKHVVLTDHNVMYGVPAFLDACKKADLHGIVGLEVDCLFHEVKVPFLLLAKDNIGFADLQRLSSIAVRHDYGCTEEQLIQYSRHCVLIVYGEGGWFDGELLKEQYEIVRQKLELMKRELPVFDVALSYMESPLHHARNVVLKKICQALKITTVALNKNYYLQARDSFAYEVLCGIREKKTLRDASLVEIRGRYYLNQEEMASLYDRDDLARTDEIARLCRADCVLPKTDLPSFPLPEGVTHAVYLQKLCYAGLNKRLRGNVTQNYVQRLQYELRIITDMHFENYFLIVYDLIRYARKHDIYVGPGRGSAAGSLVSYCLGITSINPLPYHLLFERFLNPERTTMPDIDIDIPDDRRDELIQYAIEKYGNDHVANIIAFGTLKMRQVIRDVSKVMELLPSETEQVLKLLPNKPDMTLAKAIQQIPNLKQYVLSSEKLEKVYQMAMALEDLPRHETIHAAGILLSKLPLQDVIPTSAFDSNILTCQYAKEYLQERGLIKMDFLSLRNLKTIHDITKMVQTKDPSFNIMQIPLDDANTYKTFARGDTSGIFQFESDGMQNLLRHLKPVCFDDIAVCLALYRPAALKQASIFLQGRQNPRMVRYPSRELQPILAETYGIMIYQEQAMLVSQKAAGFSLAKADLLRQAISKKDKAKMQSLKMDFLNGCLQHGYTQEVAVQLYETIEQFAGYGFNKSHAIAYAVISYQMAYLKTNYPHDFYISLLNSVIGDANKTSLYLAECRKIRIAMIPPDVNQSSSQYEIVNQSISLPFSIMKSIGNHIADIILEERHKRGPYRDFFDFVARMQLYKIPKNQLETLIDGGGLDCFQQTRNTMKHALDDAIRYSELVMIQNGEEKSFDFSLVSKPVMVRIKDDNMTRLENERKVYGFYLGDSPISQLRQQFHLNDPTIARCKQIQGETTTFVCIRQVKEHRTKKGEMMAFVTVYDDTDEMNMIVFPRQYTKYQQVLLKGAYIRIHGKMTPEFSLTCDAIQVVNGKQ